MKLNVLILFVAFILFTGCSKIKEDKNIIFLDYSQNRVVIGNKYVDESEIHVFDNINGLRLFFDSMLNNLWDTQQSENNFFQFDLIYSLSFKKVSYWKKIGDEDDFSQAAVKYLNNGAAVIKTHDSYLLYDIANEKIDMIECKRYDFLGFNGEKLFFTEGFYDIEKKEYLPYPNGEKVAYKSVYCPSKNVIITYEKDKHISIFDPNTGTRRVLDIRVNKLNSRDDRSMYYLEGDKLYYSKHKFSFEELIPMLGYYYGMNWYEYDLKTGEKTKLKTPSDKSVIVGVVERGKNN